MFSGKLYTYDTEMGIERYSMNLAISSLPAPRFKLPLPHHLPRAPSSMVKRRTGALYRPTDAKNGTAVASLCVLAFFA